MFSSLTLYTLIILFLCAPSISARVFASRDPDVRQFIKTCESNASLADSEKTCQAVLSCIINTAPEEYNTRWSAGSSILASIPTVVGLVSNSIEEISYVAEESLPMAILISMSSVTTFTDRFFHRVPTSTFEYSSGYLVAKQAQILHLLNKNERTGDSFRVRSLIKVAGAIVAGLVATSWYMLMFWISKYGVVIYSCSGQFHVAMWAGLSQLLTIVNLLLRRYAFEIVVIPLTDSPRSALADLLQKEWSSGSPNQRAKNPFHGKLLADQVVLRCSSTNLLKRSIQTTVGILSAIIFLFGTASLFGVVLFPAFDAMCAMAVLTLSAVSGKFVANWTMSSARTGKRSVVVDVSKRHMRGVEEMFRKKGIRSTDDQTLVCKKKAFIHWSLHVQRRTMTESAC
ncbi:hypothetical protein MMC14_005493 [Varicellaria rhodocarpa]|nr:hypothetical protein [Varicellaria rhodocarpa]